MVRRGQRVRVSGGSGLVGQRWGAAGPAGRPAGPGPNGRGGFLLLFVLFSPCYFSLFLFCYF